MRHGSARITVDIYSQARNPAKRAAQQRILEMILPKERVELALPDERSAEHLDRVSELTPAEWVAMWNALDQEESFM